MSDVCMEGTWELDCFCVSYRWKLKVRFSAENLQVQEIEPNAIYPASQPLTSLSTTARQWRICLQLWSEQEKPHAHTVLDAPAVAPLSESFELAENIFFFFKTAMPSRSPAVENIVVLGSRTTARKGACGKASQAFRVRFVSPWTSPSADCNIHTQKHHGPSILSRPCTWGRTRS
jgi:hypothetical protein